jgi:hypothetical protein
VDLVFEQDFSLLAWVGWALTLALCAVGSSLVLPIRGMNQDQLGKGTKQSPQKHPHVMHHLADDVVDCCSLSVMVSENQKLISSSAFV